ncbi:MAG: hypothetical protein QOJ53_2339, partial [Sphingomonadales bacterium]|nr:hypothetical protein [Sphingomonadales bacterium]
MQSVTRADAGDELRDRAAEQGVDDPRRGAAVAIGARGRGGLDETVEMGLRGADDAVGV